MYLLPSFHAYLINPKMQTAYIKMKPHLGQHFLPLDLCILNMIKFGGIIDRIFAEIDYVVRSFGAFV